MIFIAITVSVMTLVVFLLLRHLFRKEKNIVLAESSKKEMNSVNIQANVRNNLPAISVIVPAFNAEHTIVRTLHSLLTQSIVNEIEVIVIDDGSEDKTFNEASNFINKYLLDWKLISQKNGGEAAARNTGLDICSGKYILFLDADDSIVRNAIETLLANANNNNCDLVFSSYRKIISYNQYQDYIYDN